MHFILIETITRFVRQTFHSLYHLINAIMVGAGCAELA